MTSGMNEQAERVEAAWRPFRAAIDEVGVSGLDQQTTAGWTAKELLAHVAFWLEAFEYVLEVMLRGGETRPGYGFGSGYWPSDDEDWPHFDVHNAREAAWAREQPAETVLARLDAARDRHRELLQSLTDAELANDDFTDLIGREAGHLGEHCPEIAALVR